MHKHKLIHTPTPFSIVPMDIEYAQVICTWRYPQPYDIYNWQEWQDMNDYGIEFGDPHIRAEQYAAVLDANLELVGFAQFFPMLRVTRLGLGMHPMRCGGGEGVDFVRVIVNEARRRAPKNEIDLEVLIWNIRAFTTYQRAGFVHTDTYERPTPTGIQPFHCMVYNG